MSVLHAVLACVTALILVVMLCFPKERGVLHFDPAKPNFMSLQENPQPTIIAIFGTLCPHTPRTWLYRPLGAGLRDCYLTTTSFAESLIFPSPLAPGEG